MWVDSLWFRHFLWKENQLNVFWRNHLHGTIAWQHFYPFMLSKTQSISTSLHQFLRFSTNYNNLFKQITINNWEKYRKKWHGKIVKERLETTCSFVDHYAFKGEEFWNLKKLAKDETRQVAPKHLLFLVLFRLLIHNILKPK